MRFGRAALSLCLAAEIAACAPDAREPALAPLPPPPIPAAPVASSPPEAVAPSPASPPAAVPARPLAPLADAKTRLVAFAASPFPYRGAVPDTGAPFLNVAEGGRRGRQSPRGGLHWEDETYSDRRVLLHLPRGFEPGRPAMIVVFFHGNNATLERDVVARQQVPRQLDRSGLNAALVAPQFAVDTADSSAGRFWEKGFFARFLGEAGIELTRLCGDRRAARLFAAMPVVLVAYSGGYQAAA